MNLQFTSSHTRVYISEMTGTVFRAPCQTCLSVFPTGESAEPPFTMRKEGLVTIVTRFRALRPRAESFSGCRANLRHASCAWLVVNALLTSAARLACRIRSAAILFANLQAWTKI